MNGPATNLAEFSRHELTLPEVNAMAKGAEKFWGWADGLYIAGNDDMIALRLHNKHGYESVTRELWKRSCKDAPMAIDVGTHSGIFSLDAYRAGAKIVLGAEPNPINYARMVMNLRHAGFFPVGAFFGALGDEDAVGWLCVGNLTFVHAAGMVNAKVKSNEQLPVRVKRLDTLLPKEHWAGIRAVKIDAENYTPNVIGGMSEIFAAGNRPDLFIECLEGGMGYNLKKLGYKFWCIWETGKIEEVDDLLPINPNHNSHGTDDDCRNRFASVNGLPHG